jgi:gamma-glutamyltranspeptidase/glutathione hydrolase/leukotriene-C4 hydrolase
MVIRVPEGPHREGLEEEMKENGVVAIDFRETSPANSEKEMYGVKKAGRMAAQVGGLAVGVPGELRGLELGTWTVTRLGNVDQIAHSLYGSLPWEEVVMPVAKLARGWQVSRSLAGRLRVFG